MKKIFIRSFRPYLIYQSQTIPIFDNTGATQITPYDSNGNMITIQENWYYFELIGRGLNLIDPASITLRIATGNGSTVAEFDAYIEDPGKKRVLLRARLNDNQGPFEFPISSSLMINVSSSNEIEVTVNNTGGDDPEGGIYP